MASAENMRAVYTISDNITSPLGSTTQENFSNLKNDLTGIRKHDNPAMSNTAFHASLFPPDKATLPSAVLFAVDESRDWSLFERILIHSIKDASTGTAVDLTSERVIFVISSTKGNISMVENESGSSPENISLYHSAGLIASHFNNPNQPLVVSNACISGVLGILTAKRLIEAGLYDTAVVAGADLITKFILSGFQSFQAVSPEPCKPFDATRQGVTLGEAAATMIISADRTPGQPAVRVMGGATSNDANHISGPSRTGEPLYHAITRSLAEAGLKASDIGFISAHGTATVYN
ncbi:MAG: beta-ketoacyl synthase, partial [Sphingobacteriales bacterium]